MTVQALPQSLIAAGISRVVTCDFETYYITAGFINARRVPYLAAKKEWDKLKKAHEKEVKAAEKAAAKAAAKAEKAAQKIAKAIARGKPAPKIDEPEPIPPVAPFNVPEPTEPPPMQMYALGGAGSTEGMPVCSYVRDPRFELICMAIQIDDGEPTLVWGMEAAREALIEAGVERKDTVTVAHNARMEATIMSMRLGIDPNMIVCTQALMALTGLSRVFPTGGLPKGKGAGTLAALSAHLRGAGINVDLKGVEVAEADGLRLADMSDDFRRRYGEYCKNDVRITYKGFMAMAVLVSTIHLYASHMTTEMYSRPSLLLDADELDHQIANLHDEQSEVLTRVYYHHEKYMQEVRESDRELRNEPVWKTAHKVIRSTDKLTELLYSLGIKVDYVFAGAATDANKKRDVADEVQRAKRAESAKTQMELKCRGIDFERWCEEDAMKPALSQDSTMLKKLCNHCDKRISDLAYARLEFNSSQAESRTRRLRDLASWGALSFPLKYASARTHRYTGDEKINLQNLSKRKRGKEVRNAIIAREGYMVGGADSSQIEQRVLNYVAGAAHMTEIYRKGEDPYIHAAASIYGEDYSVIKSWIDKDEATLSDEDKVIRKRYALMRHVGKQVTLACGYQMGADKFSDNLLIGGTVLKPADEDMAAWDRAYAEQFPNATPEQEAADRNQFIIDEHVRQAYRIHNVFRGANPEIVAFWDVCHNVIKALIAGCSGSFGGPDGDLFYYDANRTVLGISMPGIMLPSGEWLVYRNLRYVEDPETGRNRTVYDEVEGAVAKTFDIYGGKLTENLVQALAFTVLAWQAVYIHTRGVPVKGNVHDEWFSVFHESDREAVEALYMEAMTTAPDYTPGLTLNCEFKCGASYGDM